MAEIEEDERADEAKCRDTDSGAQAASPSADSTVLIQSSATRAYDGWAAIASELGEPGSGPFGKRHLAARVTMDDGKPRGTMLVSELRAGVPVRVQLSFLVPDESEVGCSTGRVMFEQHSEGLIAEIRCGRVFAE